MKILILSLVTLFLTGFPVEGFASVSPEILSSIEKWTGAKGTWHEKENVFKVTFPRSDPDVKVAGARLTPPMGLTSWAAFNLMDDQAMVMGDLVLLENEVNPVMDEALGNHLKVTALHNHFLWDSPKVMFMHIGGQGEIEALSRSVGKVFEKMKELIEDKPLAPYLEIDPANTTLYPERIESILGVNGALKEGVFKVVIGRAAEMGGHRMGKDMGVNTWAAFAGSDDKAVVAGDFAMLESEVQAVLRALRKAKISVVALHNHMIGEDPRMIFLHYWGTGRSDDLARGLRSALDVQQIGSEPSAYRLDFDALRNGTIPTGWRADATSPSSRLARWEVRRDPNAPSPPHVLSITQLNDPSDGTFNLFWSDRIRFRDGVLEVKVRADRGKVDQGGGLIWRTKDANNYYIARYNPLENNYRVYYVKDGIRKMLDNATVRDIKADEWFTLTIRHEEDQITGWLNGQELLHETDKTFTESGGVGFWTKADAASSFDDFSVVFGNEPTITQK